MDKPIFQKQAILYLAILYVFLFTGWLLAVILPEPYNQTAYLALWGSFSVLPVLATFGTRAITHDKSPWYLKPNFRQSWKTYLFAALAPQGCSVLKAGCILYAFR
jgi:hypothetical protein